MLTLYWNYDSPYSRCIKWLLLNQKVEHADKILSWEQMTLDALLHQANPKRQVPTLAEYDSGVLVASQTDSLLIGLAHVGPNWYQSLDAKLYRLADSEVEACIIFLFRANLLKEKLGQSDNSELMLKAGVDTYKASIDLLIDHLLVDVNQEVYDEVNIGAVLLFSTLQAARSMMPVGDIHYRQKELAAFIHTIEKNIDYQRMLGEVAMNLSKHDSNEQNRVSFMWAGGI